MKAGSLMPMWRWALTVLLLLILIALAGNWVQLLQLNEDVARLTDENTRADRVPCAALPTRFLLDEPVCANKLLAAMNVTNFRVVDRRLGAAPAGAVAPLKASGAG